MSGSPDHCADFEDSKHVVGTMQPRGLASVQQPTMPRTRSSLQNSPLSQVTAGPTMRHSVVSHQLHKVNGLLVSQTVQVVHGIAAYGGRAIISPPKLRRPPMGSRRRLWYPFIRTRRGGLASWCHRSPIPRINTRLKPPGVRMRDHITQSRQSKGESHNLHIRPSREKADRKRQKQPSTGPTITYAESR